MAGQGTAATDRGVDMSGSRTQNLCSRPRSAPRWTPPTSGGPPASLSFGGRPRTRWSGPPRELRHSFVSVLSDAGVPVEQISQLVGHSGTTVTELVHRHQLRASDRCDSDGLALQSARRKRVAVRRITQFVTQQRWCEAHDGRDSLIWLGGA